MAHGADMDHWAFYAASTGTRDRYELHIRFATSHQLAETIALK